MLKVSGPAFLWTACDSLAFSKVKGDASVSEKWKNERGASVDSPGLDGASVPLHAKRTISSGENERDGEGGLGR
jgi:hypothetical protein